MFCSSYVRSLVLSCSLVLALLGLLGCGSDTGSDTKEDRPEAWTVEKGTLQLQENLRVSEGENFYFGRIADVAVADDGRMYVADVKAHHVKVISPDGALQDTVGTRGEGPGEFRHPLKLALGRGDSLYVLDGADGRVHVFTPGLTFERGFLSRSDKGIPIDMMIPRRTGSSPDNGFFFVYSPGARATVQEDAQMIVRRVSPGGTVDGTLFTTPPYRMTSKTLGNGGKLFLNIPFTPGPHYALGPMGRVHYAYGDSLQVTAYGSTGQPERTVRVPFESTPPVTDSEIADALKDRTRGRKQVKSKIPASKPAFTQLLVDADGRYWFGRPTTNRDSTAWWVATPETKQVMTDMLPSKVWLRTVQNGQAYGITKTERGAPAVVRYQVHVSE
jgi:hypothetical protein